MKGDSGEERDGGKEEGKAVFSVQFQHLWLWRYGDEENT